MGRNGTSDAPDRSAVAIIGMSGRFPGAGDVESFWRNLSAGVEAFTEFSEEELVAAGVSPAEFSQPNYVRSRPVIEGTREFDAGFFGYSPREATLADPQQRIFLECVWEALESAGYATAHERGTVGVFAGMNISGYLLTRLQAFEMGVEADALMIGNDKDSLATNVSYRLDLGGPSIAVQSFCSTSLVATHLAAESLRRGECDIAIAGGVSIRVPDRVGYTYVEGGQASPDGHVRTFDAQAQGSMFGDGAAVVALKRLDEAVEDRDTVLAVLRGSAVNNDGAMKFSYQAPSIEGQRRCVTSALARAGVDPRDVSYVEAHGTATEVGDPMEVAALTGAFRDVGDTDDKQFCLLGSLKPNVGHLDRASGVTGLIKVVQALRNELIPGTLNFTEPNPEIDFAASPFRVTAEPTPWPRGDRPRIAGISSLGMGGTNVHALVTEAPERPPQPARQRRWQVLPVSARTAGAADESCSRLAGHLENASDVDLGDVAYTLQVGRKAFPHRRVVVADSVAGAVTKLSAPLGRASHTVGRKVAFLLAGVGEQYPGMVASLYAEDPGYRADVDECVSVLGLSDASELTDLFTAPADPGAAGAGGLAAALGRTDTGRADAPPAADAHLMQPAVFVAEYALARLLIRAGIKPDLLIGYSLGEYVAACLAGVLSPADALRLVDYRAKLISSRPEGAMLAVAADEAEIPTVLGEDLAERLDLAVRTGTQPVLAGPVDDISAAAKILLDAGIANRMLDTTHAYHSTMLRPIAAELTSWIDANVTLNAPSVPYVSNVTGRVATADEVTDPGYWARHMCETVEFGEGLATVLGAGDLAIVELGPGQSLGAMARAHPDCERDQWPLITSTLPGPTEQVDADATVASAIGRLWLNGVDVDWPALHEGQDWEPGRIPLPTYPFERQEYWLELDGARRGDGGAVIDENDPTSIMEALPRLADERWMNLPVWHQTAPSPPAPRADEDARQRWLVYHDEAVGDPGFSAVLEQLAARGEHVTLVGPGPGYVAGDDRFQIRPGSPEDAVAMLRALAERGQSPQRIVHLWAAGAGDAAELTADCISRGLYTLVALARAAGDVGLADWSVDIVTMGSQRVLPGDRVHPERATLLGPARLIPVEYPGVRTRLIDLDAETATAHPRALVSELVAEPKDQLVGLRKGRRWVPDFEVLDAGCLDTDRPAAEFREGGTYLVTGGLGGIGLGMAERMVQQYQANVVLLGRTPVPRREDWDAVLASETTAPEVRRRLEGLRGLEAAGGDFVTVAGDVSNPQDVRRAVDTALERFGALNGVVHCAGVPAVGLMQFKTTADIDRVLAPKLGGTLAIADAVAGLPELDFVLLFSSTTSATGGGAGQVDYCAANAFLDGFALSETLPDSLVTSVGWCEWTYNGWTEGLDNYDEGSRQYFEWYRESFGLTFDQGWQTMRRALASGERHVVVSTQDFRPLVEMSRRSTINTHQETVKRIRDSLGRHPRPELSTAYTEPQAGTEETIAEVWAEALGLEQVGSYDNFFELGGNSLVGMEIIAAVKKVLELEYLPPHLLYQAPTVAALAEAAFATDTEPATTEEDDDEPATDDRQARIAQRRKMLRSGRTS